MLYALFTTLVIFLSPIAGIVILIAYLRFYYFFRDENSMDRVILLTRMLALVNIGLLILMMVSYFEYDPNANMEEIQGYQLAILSILIINTLVFVSRRKIDEEESFTGLQKTTRAAQMLLGGVSTP